MIARAGTPIATLEPIDPPGDRDLGFVSIVLDGAFFAPLDDCELADWS